VKAIRNDNINFGLEKCAKIVFKKGVVYSETYTGSTFETDIIELEARTA
jgi:hypothetical protein